MSISLAHYFLLLINERVTGIGPVSCPWEGHVLPLNHTRDLFIQTIH